MARDTGEEFEDDDLDEDLDGGDDLDDDAIGDVNLDMEDDDLIEGDDFDADEEETVVRARPAAKRRTVTKAAPTVEGVPKSRLVNQKTVAEVWKKLGDRHADATPVPYTISTRLQVGDVLQHARFGVGYVIEIPGPTKAEVVFEDQVRKLVHNR
ncbi:MAG: hypothetical protein EA398_15960 [Deltaproteobacteria bacterium]|nr:MAG: hypothetical protein EA398_15960 [Deltaproteobacteria bacterium]